MKRLGFVANSSSSSFVLDKSKITGNQLEAVLNHAKHADIHFNGFWTNASWVLDNSKKTDLTGYTSMDNFDMGLFFELLEIPSDAYSFE